VSNQWGLKQGQRAAVRNVVGKWVPQETAVYKEWKPVGVHSSQFALESEVMRSCREGVETVIVIKIETVKLWIILYVWQQERRSLHPCNVSHLGSFRHPSYVLLHELVWGTHLSTTHLTARFCTFSIFNICDLRWGVQTGAAYSSCGRTRARWARVLLV